MAHKKFQNSTKVETELKSWLYKLIKAALAKHTGLSFTLEILVMLIGSCYIRKRKGDLKAT